MFLLRDVHVLKVNCGETAAITERTALRRRLLPGERPLCPHLQCSSLLNKHVHEQLSYECHGTGGQRQGPAHTAVEMVQPHVSAPRADLRSALRAAVLDAVTFPSRQRCPLCADIGTPASRAYILSLLAREQRVTAGSKDRRTGTLVSLAPNPATTQWWRRVNAPVGLLHP